MTLVITWLLSGGIDVAMTLVNASNTSHVVLELIEKSIGQIKSIVNYIEQTTVGIANSLLTRGRL